MAGVDGDGVLAEIGFGEVEGGADFGGELFEAGGGGAGDADGVRVFPRWMFREVGFVEDEEVDGLVGGVDGAFGEGF